MIGILIVTHGRLAEEIRSVAELIVGKIEQCEPISISPNEDMNEAESRIGASLKRLNTGDGVLIITDLFGGTPSNLSLTFLEEGKVEVLSGVNLPILLSLATGRTNKKLADAAEMALNAGLKNIALASRILCGKQLQKKKGNS